ncbi:MAG: hypothetical protein OHK0046_42280 [Anaerolineae bacterium]
MSSLKALLVGLGGLAVIALYQGSDDARMILMIVWVCVFYGLLLMGVWFAPEDRPIQRIPLKITQVLLIEEFDDVDRAALQREGEQAHSQSAADTSYKEAS